MRDLMMLGGLIFMIPLAFRNAFVAYLFWAWTGVLLPIYYLFGFMQSVRFNMIFAAISICLLALGHLKEKGVWENNRTGVLLLIFLGHATLCALFSLSPNPLNEDVYVSLVKGFLFCLLMPYFVSNRTRIHVLIVVLVLGLGFHGTVEGLKVFSSAGAHHVQGLGGMMSDNNHWGVAMVMSLPLQLYLYHYSANRLAKLGFLIGLSLTVVSILGSHSRGAFIGMSVVGLWVIMVSRRKFFTLFIVLLIAAAIYNFAPESWFARIETIETARDDSSFNGRLAAWKISFAAALANPFFGVGFHGIQFGWIWNSMAPMAASLPVDVGNQLEFPRAAHSIYFEVLGDMGFLGLILFLTLLANGIYTRNEIKAVAKRIGVQALWARDLADLIAVGIVAYMVGGAGVSLGYFETLYALLMLMEIIKQHLLKIESKQPKTPISPIKHIPSKGLSR